MIKEEQDSTDQTIVAIVTLTSTIDCRFCLHALCKVTIHGHGAVCLSANLGYIPFARLGSTCSGNRDSNVLKPSHVSLLTFSSWSKAASHHCLSAI